MNAKHRIAQIANSLGVLPSPYRKKLRHFELAHSIFVDNRTLKFDSRGFWFLSPMPTEAELKKFYANAYWENRGDKNALLHQRDIEHFKLLQTLVPDLLNNKLSILNFGAGHGGISYLLHAMGHKMFNVEPSGTDNPYDERWITVETIDDVPECNIDLFYSSHSLEHVQNIDSFLENVRSRISPRLGFFFEVPNCRVNNPSWEYRAGGCDGIIRPPHTYYFTKDFFSNVFQNVSYLEITREGRPVSNENGDCIRAFSGAPL